MDKREITTVIFYDNDGNIYVQNRGKHSKSGEKLGFFGGGIEANETPAGALKRELKEELNTTPNNLYYWRKNTFIAKDKFGKSWKIIAHMFLAQVDSSFATTKVLEGAGIVKIYLKKLTKNPGFYPENYKDIEKLKIKFQK